MPHPKRKPLRLHNYDYSQQGVYFVTICTCERRELFSQITVGQGLAPAENRLTMYGRIAEQQLIKLPERYPAIEIDKYVIMPNHIHILLVIRHQTAGASPCPTISDVICAYKSLTVRECKTAMPIQKVFQPSFHDHIIRNAADYQAIWEYIDTNPSKWAEDRYYTV